jgi:two-component system nitrate/nitrite response regulator NarL
MESDKGKLPVRVLIVDDYEQFHQFVRSELNERPEFQIVGEAFDGLDAVHKAEDLQPDFLQRPT